MSVPFGIYETLLGILFIIIIPVILYVARHCFKRHKNRIDGYSAICTAMAILIMGIYFIIEGLSVYYHSNFLFSSGLEKESLEYALSNLILPYPTATFVLYLIPMIFLFIAAYVAKELFTKNFLDEKKVKDSFEVDVEKSDLEVARKTFHITIIAVIVCYLLLGQMIVTQIFTFVQDSTQHLYDLGISQIPWQEINISEVISFEAMARFLIVFIVAIILFLLTFTDFIRIYIWRFYPLKMVTQAYREREKNTLGPHVYFVAGVLLVGMFCPAQSAMVTISISGLGDAFATIVGVTFGKHKYKKGSSKTWEGGVGGFVSSFGFSLLSYFLLMPLYDGIILKGITMAIVGSVIFLLIDYLSPPIEMSDNILNPIIIGFVTYMIYIIPF
ncbi:MAG: hypothetical protein GF329_02145 [Candidatus Lokiarchaeota archaeon]|nr:hypothetical protein [Candidatus Lokiarchaeota archaeon]